MTGYGKAEQIYLTKRIVVEVKTLNSKQLDLSVKMPQEIRSQELEYRNMVDIWFSNLTIINLHTSAV